MYNIFTLPCIHGPNISMFSFCTEYYCHVLILGLFDSDPIDIIKKNYGTIYLKNKIKNQLKTKITH